MEVSGLPLMSVRVPLKLTRGGTTAALFVASCWPNADSATSNRNRQQETLTFIRCMEASSHLLRYNRIHFAPDNDDLLVSLLLRRSAKRVGTLKKRWANPPPKFYLGFRTPIPNRPKPISRLRTLSGRLTFGASPASPGLAKVLFQSSSTGVAKNAWI